MDQGLRSFLSTLTDRGAGCSALWLVGAAFWFTPPVQIRSSGSSLIQSQIDAHKNTTLGSDIFKTQDILHEPLNLPLDSGQQVQSPL